MQKNYLLTGSKLIKENKDEVVIKWKKFKKKLMWIGFKLILDNTLI